MCTVICCIYWTMFIYLSVYNEIYVSQSKKIQHWYSYPELSLGTLSKCNCTNKTFLTVTSTFYWPSNDQIPNQWTDDGQCTKIRGTDYVLMAVKYEYISPVTLSVVWCVTNIFLNITGYKSMFQSTWEEVDLF